MVLGGEFITSRTSGTSGTSGTAGTYQPTKIQFKYILKFSTFTKSVLENNVETNILRTSLPAFPDSNTAGMNGAGAPC